MLFASEESLLEHLTRVNFHERDTRRQPSQPPTATLADEQVLPQRPQQIHSSANGVIDDDSGRWTRGEQMDSQFPTAMLLCVSSIG